MICLLDSIVVVIEDNENKNIKGKNNIWNHLKDIIGFAEHQEKTTYGLGYKLTLTGKTDNSALHKDNATIKINVIEWYIP